MSDREHSRVFAELEYPEGYPEYAELQEAYVSGWTERMKRDSEYDLAGRIEHVLSDEWLTGRVLPRMLGAENAARIHAIRRILDEYAGRY